MPFLYEKIDTLREVGSIAEIPLYIQENVNPKFVLRPYQIAAFENFITYFENDKLCHKPTQTLFHMATGSGKTMIMAGLMLYLYKQGYRNFLFFVNLSNIVKKTKENFLNPLSQKYLFADEIHIDGETIPIKEVNNFQQIDENTINICFMTIQGLHEVVRLTRENSISADDFYNHKVVFISDEAHHLNVDTKTISKNKDEENSYNSWETTVKSIFEKNKDNVLLEFTATCDLKNPLIKAEYESKIIYDYPLVKFRADGYSKEIKTLRSDVSKMDRVWQAVMLSQYRLKVFQQHRLSIKPVVLFKSATIKESAEFMEQFVAAVSGLTGNELKRISEITENETLRKAYSYFQEKEITWDQLAQELREDFSAEHCISANDDKEAETRQIILNSLEDASNPYRAVFEVKKLDEGWDVLNLFDIVRLYETRQSGGKDISKVTISEAQLIGRGARYCPFKIDDEDQEKYKRKYDRDIENPLRICEELYYHCQNDSRYIAELNNALKEIGIVQGLESKEIVIKENFKREPLYMDGIVFMNGRKIKSRDNVKSLDSSVRDRIYHWIAASGSSGEDTLLESGKLTEKKVETYSCRLTIKDIADFNYAIVQQALCKYPIFKFNILKKNFPHLKSTREFIISDQYLGNINIEITSKYKFQTPKILFAACMEVARKASEFLSKITEKYEGTKEFTAKYLHDIIKNKKCNYSLIKEDGGVGCSQNDINVKPEWKLDLSQEDWYVFNDNFGTSEEKAFVAWFKNYVPELRKKYDKVFLVRNERQLKIYSFDEGERFEPDFLLFLQKNEGENSKYEQLQIFIEPKGRHLFEQDKWKEEFLLAIRDKAVATTVYQNDNKYKIWGFHFYNHEIEINSKNDMEEILKKSE